MIATQKHSTSSRRKAEQKPSTSSYRLQGIVDCSLLNKLADTPGDKDTNSFDLLFQFLYVS
ncbi:hypothetical protein DB41_JY00020 [Neochlamydia sp. TUME1]|uniref:hypothetical protein n=1 Tax=Neochlamydia sp. TUME1 TaxID=1478174 RepID=UPI00057D1D3E|nr:hypothetical protein [Neochlamydia sp. TUME1]KIC72954.1 hypothetical protein DB41_JY00020 [Neochlamydia sp. TUME1]